MQKIKINKNGWKNRKLGSLAEEISVRIENPASSKYDRFVGLEHFVSGDLKLEKYAGTKGLVSAGKEFRGGDILFARRNAYLRRASKVDFDGVCSGDAFVLRENDEYLMPGFLSYIVNSNSLWDFANSNAAGTMSKRVKWRDLQDYELLLPPLTYQKNLDSLLKGADTLVDKNRNLFEKLRLYYSALREKLMLDSESEDNVVYHNKLKAEVGDSLKFGLIESFVVSVKYGTSKKSSKNDSGYPVLGIPNVINEKLSLEKTSKVELSDSEYQAAKLEFGDIVIVRTNGNPEYTGRSAIYDIDLGHVFASYLIRLRLDEELYCPDFVVRYLQTKAVRRYFRRHATSSAGNYNINTETIKNLPIPIIDMEKQKSIIEDLKKVEEILEVIEAQKNISEKLLSQLINQVF